MRCKELGLLLGAMLTTLVTLPRPATGQYALHPPPDQLVGFLQRPGSAWPPPPPHTPPWHHSPPSQDRARSNYWDDSPPASGADGRLLSEGAFSKISETLGAINTVGHYLVDIVNDNDKNVSDPNRQRLPGALYTLSKNVLGPNVTDAIAPLVRRALPNVLPDAPISKITGGDTPTRAPQSIPTPGAAVCTTPEGQPGVCDDLRNCPQLLLNLVSLRESLCFKELFTPGVCCPTDALVSSGPTVAPSTHLEPVVPSRPRPPASTPPSAVLVLTTDKPRPPITVAKPRPPITAAKPRPPVTVAKPRPPITVAKPRPPITTTSSTTTTIAISTTASHTTPRPPILTAFVTVAPPVIGNFSNIVDVNECGQREDEGGRIVGGTEARPGAWPWMAAIYLHGSARREFWCGGTLVSARHVLTAAHCTRDSKQRSFPARQFTVRLGDVDLARDDEPSRPVTVRVVAVHAHERFSRVGFYNDIAVLLLAESVQKSKYVIPICLPVGALAREQWEGALATVVGWGTTRYGGGESSRQLEARLPVWRNEDCDHAYFQPITESFVCAGYARGGTDACQGDSGGPLMVLANGRWTQIGVVSFGNKCGEPGYPGVYTRLTHYLDWLQQQLH